MSPFRIIALVVGLGALLLPLFVSIPGLSLAGHITLGIFLMAAIFWVTEPIPIYATSLIVILLQIMLLSVQGPFAGSAEVPLTQPEGTEIQYQWAIPAEAITEDGELYLMRNAHQGQKITVIMVSGENSTVIVESPRLSEGSDIAATTDHWLLEFQPVPHTTFLHSLANPIIILFLGGFILAAAAVKYELDRNLTRIILKPFGNRPAYILLGLMLVTAVLSAFMSNTATTAMMMTVIIPIVRQLEGSDKFRIGLALSIPFAANIGGMATPIGTPPNAVVIGALTAQGISIPFGTWMLLASPLVVVLLFLIWQLLLKVYPCQQERIKLQLDGAFLTTPRAIVLYIVFGVTILLWVTEALHGISSSVIAFIPIALLPAFKIIEKPEIRNLSWEVLWLMAGGISLGLSMRDTGLATWLIGLIGWEGMGALMVMAVFGMVAVAMSNFISNTVAATLLTPLAISLALSPEMQDIMTLDITAVMIAVGASLGMALPISTPPNAIAISTGMVRTPDMAKMGVIIGLGGIVLAIITSRFYWPLILG
ncbi:MAG: SLC13/DASS family transporter [Opitutales bacterium]|nr:SLC13/DASS family transporter [Opitutales bacterium]MCH8539696.1 SLC13 family permease [Opitutales bacterium]